MIKYFAKKYIVKTLNNLMEDYKDNIKEVCEKIDIWIKRLEKILAQLNSLKSKVSDGQITDEEVDMTVEEIQKLVKEY